jgi:hypothetical protein
MKNAQSDKSLAAQAFNRVDWTIASLRDRNREIAQVLSILKLQNAEKA